MFHELLLLSAVMEEESIQDLKQLQECTFANNIWVSTKNIPDIVKIKTP